jgi:hypothetical protein
MKKALIILSVFSILMSCSKDGNIGTFKIELIDVVNNEYVDNSLIIRGYGSKSLINYTYQEDTFKVDNGTAISKVDFFVGKDRSCISDVEFLHDAYHPLWIYNHFCQEYLAEGNPLLFEVKPFVNLKLDISFDEAVSLLDVKTFDFPVEYDYTKRSRQLIDKNRIDCQNNGVIKDTTLNLFVIPNDSINIVIQYGKNTQSTTYTTQLVTGIDTEYYLSIEL